MALVLADRVKETTTTTGTGTVTLAGASAGYRSFATVGNGNTTYYTISGQTTSEWEVGIGTYTTVGTTLSRTTVLSSSNGGSLVVFSAGTKDVFVTYPAGRSVNVDAANTGVSVPQLSATSIINSGLTSGRVVYSTTSGLETDSANLTFNGTTLTANTIGAFTLSGTIAGGGNQINNVIIGTTTPLAGAFTTLSATGVATFSAGSAAAPAITTTGDTNTGIFFPAADTIAFTEGGAEAMRIDSSGNLGLGTTPSAWSSLLKPIQLGNAFSYVAGRTDGIRQVWLGANSYFNGTNWIYGLSNPASQYYQSDGSHVWNTAPSGTAAAAITFTQAMTLDSSGNLGIGTTSPLARLHAAKADTTLIGLISGTTKGIRFGANSTYSFIEGVDNTGSASYQPITLGGADVRFSISDIEKMRLNSSGNLGIGTTSPVTKLNISGSSTVAGELGTLAITGSTTAKRLTFGVDSTSTMYGWIQSVENGVSTRDLVLQSLGGNVGIGTTAPVAKLDVQNANAYVRIKSTSGTYALFDIDSPTANQPIIRFLSNGIEQARIISPVNEAASQLVFTTGDSGVEKMRIDASGNLMVGTTASTGSAANTALVVGGIFKTASGTVSAATATATTIFTCPTLVTGLYLVNVQLENNDPALYGAVSLVGVGNTTLRATSLATGTNITITVSGQTIRSTQTSGLTQTITWTVTRLS